MVQRSNRIDMMLRVGRRIQSDTSARSNANPNSIAYKANYRLNFCNLEKQINLRA